MKMDHGAETGQGPCLPDTPGRDFSRPKTVFMKG